MDYAGAPYAFAPFAGALASSDTYVVYIDLNLVFLTDFVFYGEIGDIIPLPPDLVLTPVNPNDRRSPCLVFEI